MAEFEQPWLTGPFWWELCGVCCWGFVRITRGFESGTKQPVIKNGYCRFEVKIRTLSVMSEATKSRLLHLKTITEALRKECKKKIIKYPALNRNDEDLLLNKCDPCRPPAVSLVSLSPFGSTQRNTSNPHKSRRPCLWGWCGTGGLGETESRWHIRTLPSWPKPHPRQTSITHSAVPVMEVVSWCLLQPGSLRANPAHFCIITLQLFPAEGDAEQG